jgi:23S rRNA (adenine2503-C2)-methyltransferase
VLSPHDMLDIPADLRQKLAEGFTFGSLHTEQELLSKDGTIKRAYGLGDGQVIESVLMPYDDGRRTACVSSQAGCAMKCVFCATGQMGFRRQLSHNEIFEQILRFDTLLRSQNNNKRGLSNVVFMGEICVHALLCCFVMRVSASCIMDLT